MRLISKGKNRRVQSQPDQDVESAPGDTESNRTNSTRSDPLNLVSGIFADDEYEEIRPPLPAEIALLHRLEANNDTLSRASSVISTGTRMSFRTISHPGIPEDVSEATQRHSGPIDIVLGRRNFRITARPGSILSISSFDHGSVDIPAPPYEASTPATDSTLTLVQGSSQDEDPPNISPFSPQNPTLHHPLQPNPRRHHHHSSLIYETNSLFNENPSRPITPPSPSISPATTSANAISAHYTNVVRTIDTNHRAEIQRLTTSHATQLSQIRNSIDAAYRIQFRQVRDDNEEQITSLNAQIEELSARLAEAQVLAADTAQNHSTHLTNLKSEHDVLVDRSRAAAILEHDEAVRKARNDVEDTWEARWRDRMRLAGEEVGAAFGERKRVADCWEEEVGLRWPDEVDEVRRGVDGRLKRIQIRERRESGSGSGSGL